MDRENYIIPFEPPAADATQPLAEQLPDETQNDTPAEDTPAQKTYEDIPAPLQRHAVKQYAGAVFVAFISAVFAVYLKGPAPLFILLGSVYMAYLGYTVKRDYRRGEIVELGVVCTGVKPSSVRDRVMVTFRTKVDGKERFYKFYVPSKQSQDEFIVDAPYVIYYRQNAPEALIAYVLV